MKNDRQLNAEEQSELEHLREFRRQTLDTIKQLCVARLVARGYDINMLQSRRDALKAQLQLPTESAKKSERPTKKKRARSVL